ncbi:hypothetical protein BC628DRAFT_1318152 [Trametes gibbosa]|nr:hypothetical protein BC628DRAFT_1318152 [Trametes gibbosa]
MQAQNDPFLPGGLVASSKLTLGMIVTHLVTGYACMDFLSFLSWDWQLLRATTTTTTTRGCRAGAVLFYFAPRYFGIAAVLATVTFLDAFPIVFINPLKYFAAITAGIALAVSAATILLRISCMYKNVWFCGALDVLKYTFWGVLARAMILSPTVLQAHGIHLVETVLILSMTTLAFGAACVRALWACRGEHGFGARALVRVLEREDVAETGVAWAAVLAMSVSRVLGAFFWVRCGVGAVRCGCSVWCVGCLVWDEERVCWARSTRARWACVWAMRAEADACFARARVIGGRVPGPGSVR